jgi:hypothetical protein
MKKRTALFLFATVFGLFAMQAQGGFGIKAGLSYNTNGEFKEIINETENIIDNKGKGKSGFNVGVYGQLDLGPLYLRPELVYTKTTSEYEINNQMESYKISKLDVPVLLGINVIGPLNVFAGPAFQYYLDNDLKGLNFESIENDFSIGLNIGASLTFGRFGFDVRYERGFSENETEFINNNINNVNYRLDSRPEQLIFSLSYRLSNKN